MGKPVHVQVVNRGNMPVEVLIKKFNRAVKKSGIIQEVRERRYYEKPSRKKYLQRKKAKFSAKLEARENARWQ